MGGPTTKLSPADWPVEFGSRRPHEAWSPALHSHISSLKKPLATQLQPSSPFQAKPPPATPPFAMAAPAPLQLVTPGIAVVTGASAGIGRACSIALAHAGWQVVLSGRRQAELDETIKLAQQSAEGEVKQMRAVVGDLSNPKDVDALFEVVQKEFGEFS